MSTKSRRERRLSGAKLAMIVGGVLIYGIVTLGPVLILLAIRPDYERSLQRYHLRESRRAEAESLLLQLPVEGGGAVCRDGWISNSSGSGTCSWHGGVRLWAHEVRALAERAPARLPRRLIDARLYVGLVCVFWLFGLTRFLRFV